MRHWFDGFHFRGLRARLLGIVLVAVVPLVGLLFVYASVQNNAAQDRERQEIQRDLFSEVLSIRDLVSESRASLVTFGITFAIQQRRIDLIQGNIVRLKALHPGYAVIAVADPDGRVIASSAAPTGTVSIADTSFFKSAIATRDLIVSGYQVDPVVGRPTINVAYPVYNERDELIAVEYIGFEPERFGERLNLKRGAFSAEILIDGNGTVIAREPALPDIVGTAPLSGSLVSEILAKRQGNTVATGLDGVTRFYYYTRVFDEPIGSLYVASGYSEDELLAVQRRSLNLVLLGFAALALGALGIAWLVGTFSIYQPVRKLEAAAERLAEGDLSARSEVSARSDEIGTLGREFDHMAEVIETHVHELELAQRQLSGLNVELESRVRQRTAELESSNRELEAFNYSVSHDLRAPLRAIDGFSQALLEDYGDKFDGEGRDHLERVKAAANRMGELIDSLLTLSRLTRCEMDTRPCDLSAIATEIIEALRSAEPERTVDVTIQPGVVGQCDKVLMRSVLENLLNNAWKFTGRVEAACIEFGATRVEGEQVYFVRDNGAGFDMRYSNKLFSAFQRLHGQVEFPGVGIGLATVSRIVWRHGGRVWAESAPGQGATFYFTLP